MSSYKNGRPPMISQKPKRCRICDRTIRHFNKSGYCNYHKDVGRINNGS